MSKITEKIPPADEIAEMADRGEDISKFFTGDGKMKPPLNKVGIFVGSPVQNETRLSRNRA